MSRVVRLHQRQQKIREPKSEPIERPRLVSGVAREASTFRHWSGAAHSGHGLKQSSSSVPELSNCTTDLHSLGDGQQGASSYPLSHLNMSLLGHPPYSRCFWEK